MWRRRVGVESFGTTDNAQLTDFINQQNPQNQPNLAHLRHTVMGCTPLLRQFGIGTLAVLTCKVCHFRLSQNRGSV